MMYKEGSMMDKFLLVFAMWSAVGWIFVWLGVTNLRRYREKEAREKERATALIADYKDVQQFSRGHPYMIHYPILRYITSDGTEYEAQDDFTLEPERYPVGTTLELFYDPTHPEDYHLAITPGNTKNAWFQLRLGIIWVLVSFLGVLLLHSFANNYGWDLLGALKDLLHL